MRRTLKSDECDGVELHIIPGGNGDYYLAVHKGRDIAVPAVRICTSGGAAARDNPRVLRAVAALYEALGEEPEREQTEVNRLCTNELRQKNELTELALLEIEALATRTPVTVRINPMTVFLIISQLQLAIRHPQNQGEARGATLEFINHLRRHISGRGDPIDTLIGMGFEGRSDLNAGN